MFAHFSHMSTLCRTCLSVLFVFLLHIPFALGETPERTLLVGFAQDHLANDWRLAQVKEIESLLVSHPHIRFTYTDAAGSTARQIQDIENLIHAGVDILITSPRDSQAMTPVIQRAHREGIMVILLTRIIASNDYTTYISPDDAAIGREAAHYMANEMGEKGRILVLEGVPMTTTSQLRNAAFLQTLRNYPHMQVVASRVGNYLRNDAIRAVEEVLAEGIEFDAIYSHSDSMASGARLALKGAGIDPAGLVIVGIDYISETQTAIIKGEQQASFTYPTCGKEAAEVVLMIAEGKTPPKKITVPSMRVDRDNVHQVAPIF